MTDSLDTSLIEPLTDHLLSIADDKLMLGHCQSEWTGLGPILEEDIAFSSIAQDELAHASAIYDFIASLTGGDCDAIAFDREPQAYRCADLVTAPDGFDWAVALLRQHLCDQHDAVRLDALAASSHQPLAALARRIRAEEQIHLDHTTNWIVRLGRGTEESRERLESAVTTLTTDAGNLLEPTAGESMLTAQGLLGGTERSRFDLWNEAVTETLSQAGLTARFQPPSGSGGRTGRHTEHFLAQHEEMCQVRRLSPGAIW